MEKSQSTELKRREEEVLPDNLEVKDILAYELALAERKAGASIHLKFIAKKFGMTIKTLEKFRREHRQDIERCEDELFESKKKIDLLVDQRSALGSQLVTAIMTDDSEMEAKIRKAILALNTLMPVENIRTMKKIVGGDSDEDGDGKTRRGQINVQINNSPAVQRAEAKLKQLRGEVKKDEPCVTS